MKKSNLLIILFLLFISNFILRYFLISKGPYHADCLLLAVNAQKTLATWKIHYLHGPGLPLTCILGSICIGLVQLVGITDIVFAVNLMSVTLSSLCIPLIYLVIRKIFDDKAAMAGAVALSFNTIFLYLSVFGNSHIPSAFFLLLGLLLLFSYLKSGKISSLWVAGIMIGLMGACRLQDLVSMSIPLSLIILIHHFSRDKKIAIKELVVFFGCAGVTASLFYVPSFFERSQLVFTRTDSPLYFRMILDSLKTVSVKQFQSIFNWLLNSVSFVGCLGIVAGYWLLHRDNRGVFYMLLGLVFIPIFIFGSVWDSTPRIYTQVAVAMIIPMSYVFMVLAKRSQKSYGVGIIILVISLLANVAGIYNIIKFRHDNALLPDFYKWIGKVSEPNAFIIERDHSLFIKYYSKRKPLGPPVTLFYADPEQLEQFKKSLDDYLDQNIPVYITYTGMSGYPAKLGFKKFMQTNFRLEHIGDHWIEDWYSGVVMQTILRNSLYKLNKLP